LKVREEHRIGEDWKGFDSRWAKEEGLVASKLVGLMSLSVAPDAASSQSQLSFHLFLSSVASWEGPEQIYAGPVGAVGAQPRSWIPLCSCLCGVVSNTIKATYFSLCQTVWSDTEEVGQAAGWHVRYGKPAEESKSLFVDTPVAASAVALNRKHQGTHERADNFLGTRALQGVWF
jgi:hypothetical protein